MSMLFFLKPFQQLDLGRPPLEYDHEEYERRRRNVKRKAKTTYEVLGVRGASVVKEAEPTMEALELLRETARGIRVDDRKVRQKKVKRFRQMLLFFELMDDE